MAVLLFVSNQPIVGTEGRPLVTSTDVYRQFSDQALADSKDILAKWDRGETVTQEERLKLQGALEKYDAMSDFSPSGFEPFYVSGKINLILDRPEQADARIRQSIINGLDTLRRTSPEKDPERVKVLKLTLAEAQYVNSRVQFKLGNFKEAETEAAAAATAVPGAPVYWWALGSALVEQGKVPQAQIAVENALKLDPSYKPAQQLKQLIDR
jgi:tetratricopeptide (TPR) repeat protein